MTIEEAFAAIIERDALVEIILSRRPIFIKPSADKQPVACTISWPPTAESPGGIDGPNLSVMGYSHTGDWVKAVTQAHDMFIEQWPGRIPTALTPHDWPPYEC